METGLTGPWREMVSRVRRLPGEVMDAVRAETAATGQRLLAEMKRTILEQRGMKRPSPVTLAIRAARDAQEAPDLGGKRLVDEETLLQALTVVTGPDGSAAVGIPREAMARRGRLPLWLIAARAETGYTITVTAAMRAWLHSVGVHLRAATTHLIVPPTRWRRPALEQVASTSRQRYQDALARALRKGAIGTVR